MKIAEMKQILVNKFRAEGCYFKKQDIHIKKQDNAYIIHIADYEHNPFRMRALFEDNEYLVYIVDDEMAYNNDPIFTYDKKGFDFESALIELGYYIATRF